MRMIPRSAFGQTVLLIGGLLLINQIVTYLSVTYYFIRPSYQQINTLVASQVETIFLEGLHLDSNPNKTTFQEKTGIRFHSTNSAIQAGLSNATYYEFMSRQISEQLGGPADVRVAAGTTYLIWIDPPQSNDIWISIPMQGIEDTRLSPLTIYLFVISILSVAGGWLFVRRLNHPLQALQLAARKVEKGQFPEPLPLEGSTEIIAVTEAFNKMSKGIRQLESDRALMTAGISHDLRTPLTRIRLASEMLPDEQDWIKDGIEHDIDDMNAIIDQFIDYARHDQQEATEDVKLNDLIMDLVKVREQDESLTIELDLKTLPLVKLRIVGIKRVLENLMENAFRYGSKKICISTEANFKTRHIHCYVRDYGRGIPKEHIPTLLAPFAQGDKARGSVGSGLGLAITKRIVESHGGELLFSNHPQGGLQAGFKIPFVETR